MAKSDNLRTARQTKQDEFYTRLEDIEKELTHYKKDFCGKTVFCNCDDPFESNFFKFFAMNFNFWGLKKLICTCYAASPVAWEQLSLLDNANVVVKTENGRQPYKIEITEVLDYNGDGAVDLSDVEYLLKNKKNTLTVLEGDGDFRSQECVALLEEADIVVTNPPFSLFREYVAQLVECDKSFVIIGNQNAIAYKEIFPLLKDNKIWQGYHCGDMEFTVPDYYEPRATRYREENGIKYRSMGNICWFTNLDIPKRHEEIVLFRTYNQNDYPKYDNYDAIEVSKLVNIPCDYDGVMGVPITFLDKYNPEQFDILGIDRYIADNPNYGKRFTLNGREVYARVLIRRKQ